MPRPAPVTVSFGADVLCGDVFLSSFELSLSSASPITFSGMAEEASSFPVENVGNAMNNDELDSGSALLVDRLTQLPRGDTTPQEEITRRVKRPVSVISSSFDSPYSRHRKSLVQDSAIVTKRSFTLPSNRLEDIIQCANENQDHRVLVTSASFPYHVEWVSASWSRVCGWSCDEILGECIHSVILFNVGSEDSQSPRTHVFCH